MTTTTQQQQEIESLRNLLVNSSKSPDGRTYIWGQVVHVAKSGMSRSIKLYIVINGKLEDITWHAAQALGKNRDRYWGITTKGAGMDMVHHLIDTISYRLYKTDLYQNFKYERI